MQNLKLLQSSDGDFCNLNCAINILQSQRIFLQSWKTLACILQSNPLQNCRLFLTKKCNTGVNSLQSAKQLFLTVENLQWPLAINCSRSKLIENSTTISWFPHSHPYPSSLIPPLPSQWEDEKLCVDEYFLFYNLVRPKTTAVPFHLNDVWSMDESISTLNIYTELYVQGKITLIQNVQAKLVFIKTV